MRNIFSAACSGAAFVSAPSGASEALYHGFGSDNGHFPQIQGCPALPLEGGWGGEGRRRIQKTVAQGQPQEAVLAPGRCGSRWPLQGRVGAVDGSGPALAFGFCPMACSLPGPFRQPRRRQGTLAATVFAVPTRQPAGTSEGTQKPHRWPAKHPVGGPGRPSSPFGPRRVLSLTSGVCVAARACVSAVGGGGPRAAPSVRFIRDTLIYNQIHLIKFLLKGIISLQRSSTCFLNNTTSCERACVGMWREGRVWVGREAQGKNSPRAPGGRLGRPAWLGPHPALRSPGCSGLWPSARCALDTLPVARSPGAREAASRFELQDRGRLEETNK